jgi:hypothetical protein
MQALKLNGGTMLDRCCYRNPAWVTNEVIGANQQSPRWSARFRMPTEKAVVLVTAAFADAGAYRTARDASTELVVEFDPVRVRRVVAAAVVHGGILCGDEIDPNQAATRDSTSLR